MNATNVALSLTVGGLFAAGCYLLLQRALLRVILGFLLLGHGANLMLLLAGGEAGNPPVTDQTAQADAADPLPQAMALTAIVITFGVTTLLLAMAYRSVSLHGDDNVQDDVEDRAVADPEQRTGSAS